MDQSYFVDWQKGKVQENPDEVGAWVGGWVGGCWWAAVGGGTCAGIGL